MLRTVASLSVFNTLDDGEKNEGDSGRKEEGLARTVTIEEGIGVGGGEDFSFSLKGIGLIEEEEEELEEGYGTEIEKSEDGKQPASPPMYLAAGLGINYFDFGGGGDSDSGIHQSIPSFDDGDSAEDYYKRMIIEYPCHPLFLVNYAQTLQSKGDLHGAEEYYYRATLADPEDGDVLIKYAKLTWELHHDLDRAASNFERAVQAAPQDAQVLAAYASFLWEVEDAVEEDVPQHEHIQVGEEETLQKFANSSNVDGSKGDYSAQYPPKSGDLEECLRSRVEENPGNSLVLRNYAQFLHETKGDLKGAEEYYSRAILADPGDGEVIKECHHNHDRASSFFFFFFNRRILTTLRFEPRLPSLFQRSTTEALYHWTNASLVRASSYSERSVQATPDKSNVLAAFASFLWETEESEKMA